MAKMTSRVPIQNIRRIRFKPAVPSPEAAAATSLVLSSPTIRVRVPKNDEPASVEFNVAVKII